MTYTFVPARFFTAGRIAPVRKIVLHTIECPCEVGRAMQSAVISRDLPANTPNDRKRSAHYMVDPATVVMGVHESDTAYGAPGANADGIQIEQAGYAKYSTGEWSAPNPTAMIQIVAALLADLHIRRNIPLHFLTAAEMVSNPDATGVTTHAEVAKAFHKTDHTDPGPNYPVDYLLIEARMLLNPPENNMPAETIRKTSTGAIEVYANGMAAPFHFADPNDAARNVATINRLAAKGLITVPWIELDDDEFDCIPRFKTS